MKWFAFWQRDGNPVAARLPATEQRGRMVQQLCEVGNFVQSFRMKLRFGELSRAPLRLLRFQLQDETVECEWLARSSDNWDVDQPAANRERTETRQALEGAIAIRAWVFRILPEVQSAVFRVYRQSGEAPTELIMTGSATREEPKVQVLSLAMRAKLYGFQFCLNNGILGALCA